MTMNRKIEYIVIHCLYTLPNMDIGVKEVREWHRAQGWSDVGYHLIIRRDGKVETGRPLNNDSIIEPNEIGAHAKGYNTRSIGLALAGGMRYVDEKEKIPDCNYTKEQWLSLQFEVEFLLRTHGSSIKVVGHRDLNPHKACPVFDARGWWYGV